MGFFATLGNATTSVLGNPASATLIGSVIGAVIAGIIGIITANHIAKRNELNEAKKDHLKDLKEKCFVPLTKKLHYIYANEFSQFDLKATAETLPLLATSVRRCYRFLVSGEKINPDYDSEYVDRSADFIYEYASFEFENDKDVDYLLYRDIRAHFPALAQNLHACEKFVQEKVEVAREEVYDLCKFLYADEKYNTFIRQVAAKNRGKPSDELKKNYFLFSALVVLTGNQVEARKYVPEIDRYGGFQKCLQILLPYRKHKEVLEVEKLQKEAEKPFFETLTSLRDKMNKHILPGTCDNISYP